MKIKFDACSVLLGRTPSATSALLIEEALRFTEFAFIQFRGSPLSRVRASQSGRSHGWRDAWTVAHHLDWPLVKVKAAMNHAAAHPDEIEMAIQENEVDFEALQRLVPTLTRFVVREDP